MTDRKKLHTWTPEERKEIERTIRRLSGALPGEDRVDATEESAGERESDAGVPPRDGDAT
jgi:hypothetical protein